MRVDVCRWKRCQAAWNCIPPTINAVKQHRRSPNFSNFELLPRWLICHPTWTSVWTWGILCLYRIYRKLGISTSLSIFESWCLLELERWQETKLLPWRMTGGSYDYKDRSVHLGLEWCHHLVVYRQLDPSRASLTDGTYKDPCYSLNYELTVVFQKQGSSDSLK